MISNKAMKRLQILIASTVLVFLLTSCSSIPKTPLYSSDFSTSLLELSQNGFGYEVADDGVRITKCLNYGREIIIPSEIDGKPVKIIADEAFYQHTDTESIILPESLTTIEGSPFYRCYSLSKILIPQNVDTITYNPFYRCSSLTKITVAPGNANYCDEYGVLFDKDKTILIAYPEGNTAETYNVPDSVNEIRDDAFGYRCVNLKTLVIRSNVTVFPDYNIFINSDQLTLMVESGSIAEQYAKEHKLHFEIL